MAFLFSVHGVRYDERVKLVVPLLVAALSFGGARVARHTAITQRKLEDTNPPPYAPSVDSARLLSLGYTELLADLLYIRLRGYYGEWYGTKAEGVAALAEAITALDPRWERIYEFGGNAMTIAEIGVDQPTLLRALALLELGMHEFPRSYVLPMLAGQIYLQDLKTEDETQRKAWDEKGVLLIESAIRKPGAPLQLATYAAHVRSKLGQRDRASQGLRELLLVTKDARARAKLLERLAEVEGANADDIAAEMLTARKAFESAWKAERTAVKPSMYLLVGPSQAPGFDLGDLATGGRDLMTVQAFEQLEPLIPPGEDTGAAPAAGSAAGSTAAPAPGSAAPPAPGSAAAPAPSP